VRIANDVGETVDEVERHRMPCASNGEIELFIHPQVARPRLLILGSTPVAAAARTFAQDVGFAVAEGAEPGAPLLALVATQGDGDLAALETALLGPARRVFFIASARKADKMREALRARGMGAACLQRLESPAGLDIGARTPAEIALAVVAAAVAWRRAAATEAGAAAGVAAMDAPSAAPAPSESAVAENAAPYINPVCGMAVVPEQARHTVLYEGERLYFCCDGCKEEFDRAPAKYAARQRARAGPAGSRS
jgi:xanthine dehydrogenase accessory factor